MDKNKLEERFLIYNLLGKIYKQGIVAETLNFLADKEAMEELAQLVDHAQWRQGILALQHEVSSNMQNHEYVRDLNSEYMTLFIGPDHLAAPPWESVYLTREHLLFGEPTFKVKEFYRTFGIACSTGENEPDDHIGLELFFMAKLIEQTILKLTNHQSVVQEVTGQKTFLTEHIMQWVPAFCNDLQKNASGKFFYQLANITLGWLEADLVYLEGVLQNGYFLHQS
ncbi:TorD/DmsD family molecular chaperone [Sporomusa acidovorans]|uniref:Chaperone protein TorD n=1 Tax=Sporomusa acidovorans (strain ATCC 49682 / DSM 3132 / Mol) TaxID=1123286 RepID=A0ABZ3J9A0_SPOA4|nr:molecular chaperone TorD family protein [Sporomusa acidovorans]OZC15984.1 chaperone protein TorD [Sporomusa acidovorans DSM 3132]SDD90930.1 chaperone TorD involved in molybdoenzyme TorA maturation [Sporomusa acidovorans]